jgi:hypothetical protein
VVADVPLVIGNLPEDVHVIFVLLLAADDEVLADVDRLKHQSAAAQAAFDQRRRDEDVVELLVDEMRLFGFAFVELEQRSDCRPSPALEAAERSQVPSLVSYDSGIHVAITAMPA